MSEEVLVVKFDFEKSTPNTNRYKEREREDGEPSMIGTVYLQKFAAKKLGDPKVLEVSIKKG